MNSRALMRLVFALFVVMVPSSCQRPANSGEAHNDSAHEAEELWTCGMHPEVIQSDPSAGCPICGMDLTPVKSAGAAAATENPQVFIEPGIIQSMGVRLERVERRSVFRHLRTIGEVEVGEDEMAVVNLRFSGWVDQIKVDRTGDPVTAGQVLFYIYSPDVVAAQEEYLLAIKTQGPDSPLAKSARKRLELWDLASQDIRGIVASGKAWRAVPIRSPQDGFVLHKNVVEGGRISAGSDLYRIGNLKRIWVSAEVYEFDAPWVSVGQKAQMTLAYQPDKVLEGQVSYIYPTLSPKTRTLKVRLEFDNPGIRLKPGMFATVEIEYRRMDDVLAIPTEAILHSGRRELVFITKGDGHFESRELVTGLVGDHHMTEVIRGLREGELVVASGQFLIDSESQLQEAIAKLLARRAGSEAPEALPTQVWSCPMHPEELSAEQTGCSKCGMDLEQRRGTAAELAEVYGEKGTDTETQDHEGHDHPAPTAQPGQYTCSMCPTEISDEPGSCSICGMFLEKVPETDDAR